MKVLLQLNDIHKKYGPQTILDGASVAFLEDQKIGVIGRNGAGKTTLCRIATGQEEADAGSVSRASDLRLSYLSQDDPYGLGETVIGFLKRHTGRKEWQCGKVAGRFQLKNEILDASIGSLPGGFRTRVKLAAMLLSDPNFLVLDEPTNYLDLKTLILLEEFLRDFNGGFLIVSHDREFLKRTCEQTLEIENGGCTLYPGNVEEYLIFKEEQKAQAESHNRNVEAKQRQLQAFVDRFRAKASKASQARSKMKQIEKMKKIETDHPLANVSIRIPAVERKNGTALSCEGLEIGYPGLSVAQGIRLEIPQGARVAVLGDNGQGKTTLLRTLAGDLKPRAGAFRWGVGLTVGYYAQHIYSALDPDTDAYAHLSKVAAPGVTRQEILDIAGRFLFKGDDVRKKAKVLSGGERARLCLAGLLLAKSPVLLFDEPTNHLDFETVEALGRALKTFSGTLFFVSHDRTFVHLVASEIVEVGGGAVRRYPGGYEDYVYHLEHALRAELGRTDSGEPSPEKPEPKPKPRPAKEDDLEKRKLVARIRKVESELAAYTKERQEIHREFMDGSMSWSRSRQERHAAVSRLIEERERLWLELAERLESL
ncbi:MAG: ABC-F family ATP-binding cassette domain-containing protein [Planctomycetota bacterium]